MLSLVMMPLMAALSANINDTSSPQGLPNQELENQDLNSQVTFVIKNLDKATFSPVRGDDPYDYGLKDGGLLNTFEYLRSLVTFKALQYALPMDIYLEGPHSKEQLNLNSKFSFGHYNPEFVDHFNTVLSRLMDNQTFVNSTASLVRENGMLTRLEKLQHIYNLINEDKDSFVRYKLNYQKMLENKTWPSYGYSAHLPDSLNQSHYWNWAESSYYFWIRRDIDGTKEQWISIIDTVLYAYKQVD